ARGTRWLCPLGRPDLSVARRHPCEQKQSARTEGVDHRPTPFFHGHELPKLEACPWVSGKNAGPLTKESGQPPSNPFRQSREKLPYPFSGGDLSQPMAMTKYCGF